MFDVGNCVRAYIVVNVVLLVVAAFALCYVSPIKAAGLPPTEGLMIPIDDGNPQQQCVEFCFFGL